MLLKLPDFLRPTCTLPFLQPFFDPVMIMRSIGLLQIKFPTTASKCIFFCGRVPWLYQYWPGGFMLFVVLCPGTPEGSTGSGSGFKASQKTGQRLKVSSDRLGEAGNRTCEQHPNVWWPISVMHI